MANPAGKVGLDDDRGHLLLAIVCTVVFVQGILATAVPLILLGGGIGSLAIGRVISPRFDDWAERHSVMDKAGAVLLFVFLAYLLWEDS